MMSKEYYIYLVTNKHSNVLYTGVTKLQEKNRLKDGREKRKMNLLANLIQNGQIFTKVFARYWKFDGDPSSQKTLLRMTPYEEVQKS